MTADPFTITIHMVSSLDGFVARKDNSISWLETSDQYEAGADAPDVEAFLRTIDCYVMGARTYELALELSTNYGWPYGDKPVIVLTNRNLPVYGNTISFYAGDPRILVQERLKPQYKSVWVVGGPFVAKSFISLNLADEIRQSVLPIILGGGTPFYDQIGQELPLHLKEATAYKNGIVELWYELKK